MSTTVKIMPTHKELQEAVGEAVENAKREFDLYFETDQTCHYVEAQKWKTVYHSLIQRIADKKYIPETEDEKPAVFYVMKATTNNKEEKMSVTVKTPKTIKVIPSMDELHEAYSEAIWNAQRESDLYHETDLTCHFQEWQNWVRVADVIAKKIASKEYV